ncbi:alpha carbonic anhydrase 8-like [Maniola jurtina]|uniref:alpha carbonic anhydrase 8-like n=1 Tax=Maniola jurtina TaxID=191418 RepID=UPI001E68A886|nr:alpha carbonic anhydrase 8-like [Maniola jurtina]
MKISAFVLLFVFCYVQCRKTYAPIDKNANVAFINMEGGGGIRPAPRNASPNPTPAPKLPEPPKQTPAPQAATAKPVSPPVVKPNPAPAVQPPKTPNLITPKPVYPTPAVNPITTPGPGSVKQLITFYDTQGKASPIRPFSYSQAVKQG